MSQKPGSHPPVSAAVVSGFVVSLSVAVSVFAVVVGDVAPDEGPPVIVPEDPDEPSEPPEFAVSVGEKHAVPSTAASASHLMVRIRG